MLRGTAEPPQQTYRRQEMSTELVSMYRNNSFQMVGTAAEMVGRSEVIMAAMQLA
jgi:hypothetical protein